MFQLSRIPVALFLSAIFLGCSPTDENVFSYQQRLASGKPIVYNRYGEQNVGCQYSWSDVRLSQKEIEDLYFIGSLATAGFGANNCLTVGSQVQIENTDTDELMEAFVEVSMVAIWNGQAPEARDYEDYFKWNAPDFNGAAKAKEGFLNYATALFSNTVMNKVKDSFDGVVNITHIHLVHPGPNADSLMKKGLENFEASFFEETTTDGETLSSCGTRKFPDYRTTRETWELIQSGKTRTAWDVHPGLLCAGQGEVIQLVDHQVNEAGEREVFGKIKIGPMKRMRIEQFKMEHLKLTDKITPEEAKNEIEALYNQKTAENESARLFLFDFEVVE